MRKSALLLVILLGVAAVGFLFLKKDEPQPRPPTVKTDASVTKAEPEPWAHEGSDIVPDPKVRFGALENGMRYMIMPHPEPPKRLALRLHIDAGSLMEEDNQQGLAHFLEHMVFNGSKNFTPDELIPKMQRLGIAFGAHANAYTSFDETVYMLDLPNLEEDTLDLAFTVMRDFADGALLKPEEIDKERGVILSEKTSRDSVQRRLMEQQFEFLLPDHLVTHRFPIGTEEVISNAPRERFVDFYTRYYIPSQITFVASGDMEADALEARIKEAFETMANPEDPGPDPDLGPIPAGTGFRTAIFTDKEVTSDELSLLSLRPYEPEPDTEAVRLERMPLSLANSIIDRRFEILAKEEGSPISTGGAGRFVWFQALEFGSVNVTPEEGRWRDAVAILEQEFRRAREHGFTEAELEEVKAKTLNRYEQLVKRAPTRKSDGRGGLASQLSNTVNDERVFSTPEENLRIVKKGLESMTTGLLHKAFAEFWDTPDLTLILTTKKAPEGAKEELAGLYAASEAVAVTPPEEAGAGEFAYTDFGPAGTVTSDATHEDLGIRQLALSNNVRVNLKQTDFEKNSIRVLARFGSGKLGQPKDKTGLDTFTSMVMNTGGLGKHSVDELERVLAGKNVGAAISVGEDAFTMSGRTTPEDLELQLQLMTAGFTDPGYREEAARQFKKLIPQIMTSLNHTLEGTMAQMEAWLHGGDGRFAVPTEEGLTAFSMDDAKAWIGPQLANSYLEVSLVGDFDPGTTVPLILKTLGALPERASSPTEFEAERKITMPDAPDELSFTYESKIPRAAAAVIWKIPGITDNISEARRLNILAQILDDRMREKIREELGASYSPFAGASPSQAFEYGAFTALSLGKPEDTTKLGKLIIEIGKKLAAEGATPDELDRAKKPALAQLEKTLRENSYWLGTVMAQSQAQPHRLDWARQRDEDYASITIEEVNALAKQYLGSSNALRIELLPVNGEDLP